MLATCEAGWTEASVWVRLAQTLAQDDKNRRGDDANVTHNKKHRVGDKRVRWGT
jgi:hypothetical protein